MPVELANFDQITDVDLDELVTAQVPEGPRIEYKRDTYGGSDGDKREALKDISSFANTEGGHLLIGVEEENGVPTAFTGLSGVDVDQEILRLEQLARSGIEPRILGIRMRSVPLRSGGHCIIARIPRSWHAPHRVSAGGHNKFYLRNSGGVHEAGVEELRTMFTLGSGATERARAFRDKRVADIDIRRGPRPLVKEGRAILHIVPLAGMMGQVQVDLTAADQMWDRFRPLGAAAGDYRINLEGLLVERGGDRLHGYTQLFRNGAIESVRAGLWQEDRGVRYVPEAPIENDVALTLPHLLTALQALNVPPPFVVMLTLEGIADRVVRVRTPMYPRESEPIYYEHHAMFPEVLISDYGTAADYQRALRPIFDALWNMGGKPRAETYDQNGNWKPELVRR
jgi:hypothetical protein